MATRGQLIPPDKTSTQFLRNFPQIGNSIQPKFLARRLAYSLLWQGWDIVFTMRILRKVALCIATLVLACGVDTFGAIKLVGDGTVDFDGTGDFFLNPIPPLHIIRFNSNCEPSPYPGIFIICEEPLDMSLLGNDIVRAEHVRIQIPLHDIGNFFMRFGCPTCSTMITVDEAGLVALPGGRRLSDKKIEAVQALIDQHGAASLYMSIFLGGGVVEVRSSVSAVAMDIKPGDNPNMVNPRSRGVIPIAVLSTETFDASLIDVASLRFGATGKEAAAIRGVLDDVDADGDTDLLVFFSSQDSDIDCETLFTYISGVTMTGPAIAGTDSVAMVGCKQ